MSRRPTILLALALAALASTSSIASAATLEAKSAPLGKGAPIVASSKKLVLKTASLSVECAESSVTGQVEANGGEPAEVQISKSSFTGTGGARCKTSSGILTAAVEGVEAGGWQLELWREESEGGGIGQVTGTPVTLKVGLYLGESKVATCIYTAGEVGLKYEFGTPLTAPPGLVVTGATFKKAAGSSETCAEAGELSGEFALSSGALPVSIDGEGCLFDPASLDFKGAGAGAKKTVKILNPGTAQASLEDAWIEEGGKKTTANYKLFQVVSPPDECALPGAKPFQNLGVPGGFCIIGIEFFSGAAGKPAKFVVEVGGFFRNSKCHLPIVS